MRANGLAMVAAVAFTAQRLSCKGSVLASKVQFMVWRTHLQVHTTAMQARAHQESMLRRLLIDGACGHCWFHFIITMK